MKAERRFPSLKSNLVFQARESLRGTLAQDLPNYRSQSPKVPAAVSDPDALEFLLSIKINRSDDPVELAKKYKRANKKDLSPATFQDVLNEGWLWVVWGRIRGSSGGYRALKKSEATTPALSRLFFERFETSLTFLPRRGKSPAVQRILTTIPLDKVVTEKLRSSSPTWVAARLWERLNETNGPGQLSAWFDRWELLGLPTFNIFDVWQKELADLFVSELLTVLNNECASSASWGQQRTRLVREMARDYERDVASIEAAIPRLPNTVIERALWLENPQTEHYLRLMLDDADELAHLYFLVLDSCAEREFERPHETIERLILLALDMPGLFAPLLFGTGVTGKVLADMAFIPQTMVLACIIARAWRGSPANIDREVRFEMKRRGTLSAFGDLTALLVYHVNKLHALHEEIAAFLLSFYGKRKEDAEQWSALEASLREAMLDLSVDDALPILWSVVSRIDVLGSEELAVLTRLLELQGVLDHVSDELRQGVLQAYRHALTGSMPQYLTPRLTNRGAAAFASLFLQRSKRFLNDFLHLAPAARFEPGPENDRLAGDGKFLEQVRAHFRVLTRAIAGSQGQPDSDLISTVIWYAESCAAPSNMTLAGDGMFSVRFENVHTPEERLIAVDVGDALVRMEHADREMFLNALLKSAEPFFFTSLLRSAPPEIRDRIRKRLRELTPDKAGAVFSLDSLNRRIDSMVGAREPELLQKYLDDETRVQTFGKVPGRELRQFSYRLQSLLVAEDWTTLENEQVPAGIPEIQRQAAQDILTANQALAEFRKEGGNVGMAIGMLNGVLRRDPRNAAIRTNIFSAQLALALNGQSFGVLQGEPATALEANLREFEENVRPDGNDSSLQDARVGLQGWALLALGRPSEALAVLSVGGRYDRNAQILSARVVALSRVGRVGDAERELSDGISRFGEDEYLQASKAYMAGAEMRTVAPLTAIADDSMIGRIKAALSDLGRLEPQTQAQILHPEGELRHYITNVVRLAGASVTSMKAALTGLGLMKEEDYLNVVISELVTSHLHQISWDARDQSKGGKTAKGNLGERDIVIRKNTSDLAVAEALILRGMNRTTMRSHFDKLFEYSSTNTLLYLVYLLAGKEKEIVEELELMAAKPPDGNRLLASHRLNSDTNLPTGFIADYEVDGKSFQRHMAFLIVDLT